MNNLTDLGHVTLLIGDMAVPAIRNSDISF
jgi:hypothetical protein